MGLVRSRCGQPAATNGPLMIIQAAVFVEFFLQMLSVLFSIAVERLVVCNEGLDLILRDEDFLVRSTFRFILRNGRKRRMRNTQGEGSGGTKMVCRRLFQPLAFDSQSAAFLSDFLGFFFPSSPALHHSLCPNNHLIPPPASNFSPY